MVADGAVHVGMVLDLHAREMPCELGGQKHVVDLRHLVCALLLLPISIPFFPK